MILTITMNPSVDISYSLNPFKIDDVNRVESVSKTAGGKGLNVARVISQMNEEVKATGIMGGTVGSYISKTLKAENIKQDFLMIKKESRNCIAILHEENQTEILESGPTLEKSEGDLFLKKLSDLLNHVSIVTISGSLPKGLSPKYYQKLISLCEKKKVPVLLDTSGRTLKETISNSSKPLLIKPNETELGDLINKKISNSTDVLKKALSHEIFNEIEYVIVSLGADGAFAKYKESFYRITIPKIKVMNPVGSGDATMAGLAIGLKQKKSIEETLKLGMTTGMLNTMEKKTSQVHNLV
ncbi:MAG: hexose kinase [Atopostipes suicloacalis]|nr:hexose kinase [Atopostipes suicloacalis]